MTLREIIINCETYNEFSIVFAKRENDKFYINSEAVVLELDENEMCINTNEISKQKCPGYDYFLEIFIIQDMYKDLKDMDDYKLEEKLIERIIYYAENDA